MKQLNFNELIDELSLHKIEAILKLKKLEPLELSSLYGTLLLALKSGDWDKALAAVNAALHVAPHLTEKYQIETLFETLLLKLKYQKAPTLTPALEAKEASIRTGAITAIAGLVHGMNAQQCTKMLEHLSDFVKNKDINAKRDSKAAKAAIDALGILVAKLGHQQKISLLQTLDAIDKKAALEQPALDAAGHVIGMLRPSFSHIHFTFHLGHKTTNPEKTPLLKALHK